MLHFSCDLEKLMSFLEECTLDVINLLVLQDEKHLKCSFLNTDGLELKDLIEKKNSGLIRRVIILEDGLKLLVKNFPSKDDDTLLLVYTSKVGGLKRLKQINLWGTVRDIPEEVELYE